MPSMSIGFTDTLDNPHCNESMLGCDLIVVTSETRRRTWGRAHVISFGNARVVRRNGIAVVCGPESDVAKLLGNIDAVPDPVVIAAVAGKAGKKVMAAAKKRGADLVVIGKGTAVKAQAHNGRGGHGCTVMTLSESAAPAKPPTGTDKSRTPTDASGADAPLAGGTSDESGGDSEDGSDAG